MHSEVDNAKRHSHNDTMTMLGFVKISVVLGVLFRNKGPVAITVPRQKRVVSTMYQRKTTATQELITPAKEKGVDEDCEGEDSGEAGHTRGLRTPLHNKCVWVRKKCRDPYIGASAYVVMVVVRVVRMEVKEGYGK